MVEQSFNGEYNPSDFLVSTDSDEDLPLYRSPSSSSPVTVTQATYEVPTFREDPTLQRIFRLHPLHRRALCVRFAREFQQRLNKGIDDTKTLAETDLDTAIDLFSRLAPICRTPSEIQEEILLIAIQANGQSPVNLMQVCRRWRNLIMNMSRLWSSLKVGVWTVHEAVESNVERSGAWPLEVEINTKDEIRVDLDPGQQYKALLAAMTTASRWKSLKLVSFSADENSSAICNEDGLASRLTEPLSRLESFIMLDPSLSSPFVSKLLSIIGTTSKGSLKTVQVPCPNILSSLAGHSNDYDIFHNLVILKVHIQHTPPEQGTTQSLDLLPHLKHVEVLELTSTDLPDYRADITLPLIKTLRQLTLKATSIQWLFGRTLSSLLSCTIISPHRTEHPDYKKIDLPLCEELVYDGHPLNTLCHFLLPVITQLSIRNEEWTKKRTREPLDWMRSGLAYGQLQGISVLSLDLIAFSEAFVEPLAHLSCLQEFALRVSTPLGLDCRALRKICTEPVVRSDKPDGDHWNSWSKKMGELQASLWPLLTTIQLRFKRWFRDTEEETGVVPVLAAIAWTRAQLNDSRHRFQVLVEKDMKDSIPLELVGEPLRAFSLNGTCDYGNSAEVLEVVVAFVVLNSVEIRSQDTLRFLSQPPCRSVLRSLRALKLHRSAGVNSQHPINVLPYLERLEVLEMHSFHLPIYSRDTKLPLVRTLKRLTLRHISIQWMLGRRFNKLAECSIWNPILASCAEGQVIKMPVCTHMLFGDRTLEGLGLFHLPSSVKLVLVNPWFPDLPAFARRWIKGTEVISKAINVTSLQLEAGVFDNSLITTLRFQPRLEELMVRTWGCDGLEMLLSALIFDNNILNYHEGYLGDDGNGSNTIIADGGTDLALRLCPHLQRLHLNLENFNYGEKRNTLRPLCERVLESRRLSGRPLRSFKISWGFGEREAQLV